MLARRISRFSFSNISCGNAIPGFGHLHFSSSPHKDDDVEASSKMSRVKSLWKKYGMIAVGTYLSVYAVTLGGLYFVLEFGVLKSITIGVDPIDAVKKVSCFEIMLNFICNIGL